MMIETGISVTVVRLYKFICVEQALQGATSRNVLNVTVNIIVHKDLMYLEIVVT